jgi:hypothetical protein
MNWVPISRKLAISLVRQERDVVVANRKEIPFHDKDNIYHVEGVRELLNLNFIEPQEQLYTEPRNVTKLHILFYMEEK